MATYRSVFDAAELRAQLNDAGINTKFMASIWKYVLQNPGCELDEIPDLPSSAYRLLRTKFKPFTSTVHSVFHSTDGVTTKLLIKLQVNMEESLVLVVLGRHCAYRLRLGAKWVANFVQLELWDLRTI